MEKRGEDPTVVWVGWGFFRLSIGNCWARTTYCRFKHVEGLTGLSYATARNLWLMRQNCGLGKWAERRSFRWIYCTAHPLMSSDGRGGGPEDGTDSLTPLVSLLRSLSRGRVGVSEMRNRCGHYHPLSSIAGVGCSLVFYSRCLE